MFESSRVVGLRYPCLNHLLMNHILFCFLHNLETVHFWNTQPELGAGQCIWARCWD